MNEWYSLTFTLVAAYGKPKHPLIINACMKSVKLQLKLVEKFCPCHPWAIIIQLTLTRKISASQFGCLKTRGSEGEEGARAKLEVWKRTRSSSFITRPDKLSLLHSGMRPYNSTLHVARVVDLILVVVLFKRVVSLFHPAPMARNITEPASGHWRTSVGVNMAQKASIPARNLATTANPLRFLPRKKESQISRALKFISALRNFVIFWGVCETPAA